MAAGGMASTAYFAIKGEDRRLWVPLGYFSLMEALQAFSYGVIDDCANPANQVATVLAYLHVTFQPLFFNMLALYFIPPMIERRVKGLVCALVFIGVFPMLLSMYPFEWAQICPAGETIFCGPRLCSVSGSWHMGWEMPRSTFGGLTIETYVITGFLLPLLYGSWKLVAYLATVGPLLAYATSEDLNEWPAVWCLFSVGLVLAIAKTPLRTQLHVHRWPLFPKSLLRRHRNGS